MQSSSFPMSGNSLFDRLVRIFYEPRTSFETVRNRDLPQDWFIPVFVATVVGLAAHFLTLDITHDPNAPKVQQYLDRFDEEQRVVEVQKMAALREHSWFMVPVGMFTSLVVVGGILLMLVRSVFKLETSWREMLVVKAYASMLLIPEWVVRTLLMLSEETATVYTGLGAFVTPELMGTFAGSLLISVNFFDLWQCWVLGLGLSIIGGAPRKRAIFALFALWGLWTIAGAAVETVSSTVLAPQPGT